MQVLKQYVDLIQQFKAKKEELAIVIGDEKTMLYKFYEGIAEKKYLTDEDASKDLYNGEKPTYAAYKTLKSEFKKRLISGVLILDFKQPLLNDIQQAYYTCQKNWATINILIGRQKTRAVIDLAQTTLELAKKYELTEVIVNTSRVLSSAYHIHRPLSILGDEYAILNKETSELLQAEYLGESLYDDLSKHFVKIKATQRHLQPIALEHLSKLKPLINKYSSYRLHLHTRLIEIISFMCVNDYEGALNVSNEAISFFDSKPFSLKAQTAIFLHQKTVCCMQLKRFEEGRDSALRSRSFMTEGTHNWYKDGLTYIQLCLHNQQYTEGWKIYLGMHSHPETANQNPIVKEELNIVGTYLQYLINIEKIKLERTERKFVNAFNYYDFINNSPVFQKDKRGMNITVLIAQILWLLREKNYGLIKSRAEALDKYRTRHVSNDADTFRTNMFIKLVNQLEKGSYRRKRVEKRCEKTLEILKSTPIQIHNQAYATEILPYEDTWALMVNNLS